MGKTVMINVQEIEVIRDSIYHQKFETERRIKQQIKFMDSNLEKILYYNNDIEVDWCQEAHNVYQENKEEYLSRAHKSYASDLKELVELIEELAIIKSVLKKLGY